MYLLAVVLILAEIQTISKAQEKRKNKSCRVFNRQPYVQFGSEVQVTCQHSCSSGTSSWTVNNRPVPARLSEPINSTHTVLSLKNFTLQSATIQCHHALTRHVLGGTTIKTYTKPSNVSCLLHPKSKSGVLVMMVCSWEHKMNSSLNISYIVQRTCDACSRRKIEYCSSRNTSCVFESAPALVRNFSIVVRANTSAWEVESATYSFVPFKILVLAPPELHVTAFASHLQVRWNQTKLIDNGIHCEVRYSQSLDNGTEVRVVNVSVPREEERAKVTITGVESCAVYTVSARCAMDGSPWSDWSPGSTVVSMLNPKKFKFNLWRKIVKQNSNAVREVKVMWTEIPQTCKEEFRCHVNSAPVTLVSEPSDAVCSDCSPSRCFVSVAPEAHVIQLSILQNELSVANETVHVPAAGGTPPQVSHIQASASQGTIQVGWQAPRQNASGYMVDWTCDGDTYLWKWSQHTDTKLHDLRDFQLYNITVTPVFDNETGQGKEAPQVCSKRRVPQAIDITDLQPKETGADVRWRVKLEDCSTDVAEFCVFYGQTDKLLYNISVSSTQSNAVLENLKPSTNYRVKVMAKGITGNISSAERHFETEKHYPVHLVLAVCAAVGVFSCIFMVFYVWYKIVEKMVPDPGDSTLAQWNQKCTQITPQFSQPSEGETIYARVYTCASDGARDCLVPPHLAESAGDERERPVSTADRSGSSAGGVRRPATEEEDLSADRAGPAAPDCLEDEDALLQEYLEVLSLSQSSPYRSQSAAPPPGPKGVKDRRHLPGAQHDTMYVSLDMFREGPDRG